MLKKPSSKSIPTTILKQLHIYLPFLTNSINHSLHENSRSVELKQSGIIPLYNKLDPLKKENCKPMNFLPHASKVFERIL